MAVVPDARGQQVTEVPGLDTIEAIAVKCDLATLDPQGRRLVGGHSLRVTGAKHWAGIGRVLHKLFFVAKWSSDVILHYVGAAPLSSLTGHCRSLVSNGSRKRQWRQRLNQGSS